MIQELLGGTNSSGLIGGDQRKMFSINGGSAGGILEATSTVLPHHSSLLSPSPSPSPSPSSSTSSAAATAAAANNSGNSAAAAAENLRCPRCDSANTKFCYYNNYNLTQPRHFCKTCRRYWTKGGALRNVPIGGGCRKNKSPAASVPSSSSSSAAAAAAAKSIAGGKMKIIPEPRPGFAIASPAAAAAAFDLSPSSPILWGSPQNSHLLALLRSAQHNHHHLQNPNPNPNANSLAVSAASLSVKEEGAVSCIGSHMVMSCSTSGAESVSLGRSLGLDPVGQAPSLGLCSSFWRSPPSSSSNNVPTGFTLADHHQISNGNAGIQELYQRLRSSTSSSSSSSLSGNNNSYYNDQTAVVLTHHHHGHVGSSSSSMESAPVNGGGGEQLGFWNNNNSSAFTWTDLPTTTTNGAYP